MRTHHLRASGVIAAGIAGLSALAIGAPAQAQSFNCVPGVFGNGPLADLFANYGAGGSSCQVGDKIYSDFTLLVGTPRTATATINENPALLSHTISIADLLTAADSPLSFSFKVKVAPSSSNTLDKFTASVASSQSPLASNNGNISVASALGNPPGTALGFLVNGNSNPGTSGLYGNGVTEDTFTLTVDATGGTVDTYSSTLTQRSHVEVPGPLAILGAGTAFGFSRKLRRRITQAV
jgi:hypothetical protein